MRIYFVLIITAITLSFSTAYFALNLEKNNIASSKDILEIENFEDEFVSLNKAETVLDLSAMYPSRDFFQLINPISNYSKNDTISNEAFFSRPCSRPSDKMSREYFSKNDIWEDFRCARIQNLPEKFFESPPLIKDSGISFAYFAYLSNREPFNTVEWIKSNINFFHVSELNLVPAASLEGNFKVLSMLNKGVFEEITSGGRYILSSDFYLAKDIRERDIKYKVYSRMMFDRFFKERSYFIKIFKECFEIVQALINCYLYNFYHRTSFNFHYFI
jgi:hypothetical protein